MENMENKHEMHHNPENEGHSGKHSLAMYKRFCDYGGCDVRSNVFHYVCYD